MATTLNMLLRVPYDTRRGVHWTLRKSYLWRTGQVKPECFVRAYSVVERWIDLALTSALNHRQMRVTLRYRLRPSRITRPIVS